MKATGAPATAGAMLYHSMLIHVPTCPTSFHHLYWMMKLARLLVKPRMSANSNASRIRLRICDGRINQNFRFQLYLYAKPYGSRLGVSRSDRLPATGPALLLRARSARVWLPLCSSLVLRLGAARQV